MTQSKSHAGGVENLKFMIVAISLTATLLFWAVFSSQEQAALIGELQNPQPAWVSNLPPIPTVVLGNKEDPLLADGNQSGAQPVAALRSVSEPAKKTAVPQTGPIIIGGGGGRSNTSTKSS